MDLYLTFIDYFKVTVIREIFNRTPPLQRGAQSSKIISLLQYRCNPYLQPMLK